MTRKITKLAAGMLAVMLALISVSHALASQLQYVYDFQKSVAPWTAGVDCNPEMGLRAGPEVGMNDPCSTSGMLQLRQDKKYGSYAALYNKGATALWMQNTFFQSSNALSVQFDAFPVENAGRLTPLIYAGFAGPNNLGSFQKIGVPLQKGWQHLTYKVTLPPDERPGVQIVVAIGFLNLDGIKVKQAAGIDNVRITFADN
jgi:hypothetical protein